MTETSFPVMNKPMGVAEWETIALGFAQGIIDEGGWPYLLGAIDDVNSTITIRTDQITGVNRALLSGHAHRIDHDKVITLPAVSTTTTYEVGLVYDPNATGEAGPITLTYWAAPGDYSEGKNRLILYRITRQPSQVLSAATVQEWRQRVSPRITVSKFSDLPKVETMLVDTEARVRATNDVYRLNKATDGTITWTKANPESGLDQSDVDARIDTLATGGYGVATPFEIGSRVMARFPDGTARVKPPKEHWDVVNLGTLQNGLAGKANSSHTHTGAQITSRIPYEHVDGSRAAYDQVQSGQVYTVSVNPNGDFMRFSSKRADKAEIEPLAKPVRAILEPAVVRYRRRHHETREVPEGAREEWGFIADDELERTEGTPELVLTEPDEDGKPQPEGWDNAGLTAGHHKVLQWEVRRVDALIVGLKRVAEKAGVDLSDLLEALDDEGEG